MSARREDSLELGSLYDPNNQASMMLMNNK